MTHSTTSSRKLTWVEADGAAALGGDPVGGDWARSIACALSGSFTAAIAESGDREPTT